MKKSSEVRAELTNIGLSEEAIEAALTDMLQKGTIEDDEGFGDDITADRLDAAAGRLLASMDSDVNKGEEWFDSFADLDVSPFAEDIAKAVISKLGSPGPTEFGKGVADLLVESATIMKALVEDNNLMRRTILRLDQQQGEILSKVDKIQKGGNAAQFITGLRGQTGMPPGLSAVPDVANEDLEVAGGEPVGFDLDHASKWILGAMKEIQKGDGDRDRINDLKDLNRDIQTAGGDPVAQFARLKELGYKRSA